MKKHCVAKVLLAIWEIFLNENNHIYNFHRFKSLIRFYSLFVLSCRPKTRIRFPASWWSGKEKYFCFLFKASRTLFQSHAEFNRLLWRNFLICYSCSYYSSMLRLTYQFLYSLGIRVYSELMHQCICACIRFYKYFL